MTTTAAPADLWRVNPRGEVDVHLHAGQAKAFLSKARFVIVCAGTQSGKTSFGPLWLFNEIKNRGPGDYLVATPTFPLLQLKLLPEFLRFFEEKLKLGRYVGSPAKVFTFSDAGAQRTFGYRPDVPTQVFFGHAQDPDSLESATAKGAWLDEAGQRKFKKGSWEAILRRLSIHQGRVLITSTPYSAFGWFKTELHDRAKAGDPAYDWIRFESVMNPAFPREEWERAKATLPKWRFDLMYRGMLTRPAGLIYDCWDDDRFVVPDFAVPAEWPRYVGVDFGGVNTAAVFLAEEPAPKGGQSTLWLYREYHAGGRTAAEHARALLEAEPRLPDATGGAKSEGQWRGEFAAAGLPIRQPQVADVEVGIQRVYGLIKAGRLRVLEGCEETLEQLRTYSRRLDDNDQPTEEIEDKERYHLLDALRYAAVNLTSGPARIEPIGLD